MYRFGLVNEERGRIENRLVYLVKTRVRKGAEPQSKVGEGRRGVDEITDCVGTGVGNPVIPYLISTYTLCEGQRGGLPSA